MGFLDRVGATVVFTNKRSQAGEYLQFISQQVSGRQQRQCTRAITLRRSAMSVTLHSDCLLCSGLGFSFLLVSSLWTGFSFFNSLDGVCRSRLTLLESECCPTSFPTRTPEGPGISRLAPVLDKKLKSYIKRENRIPEGTVYSAA